MNSKSLLLCFAFALSAATPLLSAQHLLTDQSSVESRVDHLPLVFEPNKGQADREVRFLSRGDAYAVLLKSDRTVIVLPPKAFNRDRAEQHQPSVVTVELLRSNKEATPEGLDLLAGKSNYFIGKQSANWIAGIPQYGRVAFKSIYAGIDLVYYGHEGQLEYDFVLAPGADPRVLRFRLNGVNQIDLDSSGNLSLKVPDGTIELHKPGIYQEIEGVRRAVAGSFVLLNHNEVGLEVGNYDSGKPLVIDPVLSYSTLIGANNSTQVQGVAVDSTGDVYIAGSTFATNYPTVDAFQSTNNGTTNVVVTKLNPAGNKILYSTYLGGGTSDNAAAIAVDGEGNAYLTGTAGSSNFPTTSGAFMTTCSSPCNTPFVSKFLTDGSLAFSTFMGGSNSPAHAIAIDAAGEAYITGLTASNDIPTTPGSFEPIYPGLLCTSCYNAYVDKLNASGTALVYSTYFGLVASGGTPSTEGTGIAVDGTGSAYVVGNTTGIPTQNPLQSSQVGGFLPNAFVTKLSPDGGSLVFSTYLGGTSPYFFSYAGDFATGVAVDLLGNIHVIGTSSSCDFPLSLNALSTDCVTTEYTQKVFVTVMNPTGSRILFSTFLQSGFSSGIAVDKAGNSYATGIATANDFPLLNPIEGAAQQASSSSATSFITELDLSGKLLFSTYLGATGGGSSAAGIAVDSHGGIYVAGFGQGDFPLLHPIPSQVIQNTYYTFFVSKILPTSVPQFSLSPRVSPVLALRNVSSVPLTISAISHSSNFTEGGNCGASLLPGTGCTLILEGADDKKKSGTVTITSNAYATPQEFVIAKSPTGDSVGAILTLSPSYIQFPSQLIGTTSGRQQIVLQNAGLLPAAISGVSLSHPSAFKETNNCPALLIPASACTISVTYTAANAQDFDQLIVTSDPNQPQNAISLYGYGSTTAIVLSTSSIQFGSQFVGAAPLARIVNVANATPYPATVTGISASTGYLQTNTCNSALAPQAECRVSVAFSPTSNQEAAGTLTLANYGPGGPQTVNLLATAIKPGDLGLSPASLSFSGYIGYTTGGGTAAVTNNSQKTINIQSIKATTPFLQTNTCASSLGPGTTCQISVSFKPTEPGAVTGTLQVIFAGTGSPQITTLTGTAQTIVQFNPIFDQAGAVPVNASIQVGSGIANYGFKSLTLGSVSITGTDFTIVENSCGKTLPASYVCGITLAFKPSAMGLRTGTLSVRTSDYSQPITSILQGTGISSGLGALSASSLSFAAEKVGTQSPPKEITLTNTGTGVLPLVGIAASPQFFVQTNTCGSSLGAGAKCTISISFAPNLQGILVGSLSVQDDGLGSPHTVALTGIGK